MTALAWSQCFAMQAQTLPEVSLLRQDTAEVVLPWPVNVQTRLDSLVKDTLFERTQLGLMVYDLSADSVLYSYGGKQTLRPASTMKLLTSVTALDLLGSGYAYRTYLYYKGTITKGVLSGDVWLVGGMDPLFDETDMRIFAETLHRVGVDTIRGRIMQDISFKEEQLMGEGWCWDDDNPQLTP
jgi:D-alanyl-D-alanine carboxypeptidase/D-alanyl-D-alanine-endopeptidase (penicillin-binding protein 4)